MWSPNCPKAIQKLFSMVPKWDSGRLIRHKSGQGGNPGPRRHHDADSWGRFGRPLGVMLGFMLGLGIFFRDYFLMPFGHRFGPQHGRKLKPKSSPKPSPRRPNFELGNRCQKWSKISWISMVNDWFVDMFFDDFSMRCMSRVCFGLHERMSKKHAKTSCFWTIFENRPFCLNLSLSSKFDRRWSWNRLCL